MCFGNRWFYLWMMPAILMAIPPPAPSGGVVEREIEAEYEGKPLELEKDIPSIEIDIPKEKLSMPSSRKVLIRKIQIEGNEAISEKEIQKWLKPYLEKELQLVDIYQICQLIDQNYAKEGFFLARAYPPPQEIREGILIIRIVEGRIGSIRIEGNKYYSTRYIERYFRPFRYKTLNYNEFLRELLLLNENSDLSAGVIFEKGKEMGTADLIVRVDDHRPMHLYFNENNYGRNLTTNAQLGGRFDFGNLFFYGDMFSLAEVIGFPVNALYFTDATYTMPLNAWGGSLELAYLFTKFHIEKLTSLKLRGESSIGTVKANQALTRTKTMGLDLFLYLDIKQIQNFVLGSRISFDRLRVLTGGILFDHYNWGGGRDYLNCRIGGGLPNFMGGMPPVSDSSSRVGGGGQFLQINLDYDRIQRIYREWMFYFHFTGQWSPSKLTLPQQLYIGGSSSVRGYPLSVALGDSGYYANFETRFPLPFFMNRAFIGTRKKWKEMFKLVGFLDTGGTIFNGGSKTFITGAGFGLRVQFPLTFALSFDLGFPLNHHDLSDGPFGYLKITANPF